MRSMLIKALALAALALFAVGPVRAQPPTAAQTAQAWGLIGAWQTDCAAAPSPEYPRGVFEVRNGALVYERFSGGDSDNAPITGAVRRPDGALVLTIDFTSAGGFREWVIGKADANRFRSLSNRSLSSGVYSVRDGLLVATGQPTPWNHRCSSGR